MNSIKEVIMGDDVVTIDDNAFSKCTGITSIKIGNGVEKLGANAFNGCSNLTRCDIGPKVNSIGKEAYAGCTAITRLICRAATPPACGTWALQDIDKWNCTLSVPEGSITAYQQADQWKDFFFMDNDMTKISSFANESVKPTHIYDLNGLKTENSKRGMNIIKMNDGSVRKIIAK